MNVGLITSATLLDRVKDVEDQAAWDRFYEFYYPLVIGFCRKKGCEDDMAYDVLQESMVTLMRILPEFDYNPRKGNFRSFLLKVVERRIMDAYKRDKFYQKSILQDKKQIF